MEAKVKNRPAIFRVNWFRKEPDGSWMWPGFGQNMRVLQWVVNRVNGRVDADESIFGHVPRFDDINWNGLAYDEASFAKLMSVDPANSVREFEDQSTLFASIGARMPQALEEQRLAMLEKVKG
jgi:phosphoenolpyruvate carboxykinase (GTP)